MLAHGLSKLVTNNAADFALFSEIEALTVAAVAEALVAVDG